MAWYDFIQREAQQFAEGAEQFGRYTYQGAGAIITSPYTIANALTRADGTTGDDAGWIAPGTEDRMAAQAKKQQEWEKMTPSERKRYQRAGMDQRDYLQYLESYRKAAETNGHDVTEINPSTGYRYDYVPEYRDPKTGKPTIGRFMYEDIENRSKYELTKMTTKQLDQTRMLLWKAGFYGDEDPVLGVHMTTKDADALKGAMIESNAVGVDYRTIASNMATAYANAGIDPSTGKPKSEEDTGPSPAEIKAAADQFELNFSSFAYNNGVHLSEQMKVKAWKDIMAGKTTEESVFQDLRENVVASAFPQFEERIKGGYDVMDIASPFIQAKAAMLELNPSEIDLFDGQVRKAVQSGVSLADFEDTVRRDPRWATTAEANRVADDYINQFDQIFRM